MYTHKILIIDDERGMLDSLSTILSDDYSVLVAENGEEGLQFLAENAISLLLLDLRMPGMSGAEVLKKIRETDSYLKVIIMTGHRDWEHMTKCADLGIQGYIEKPFNPVELLARLRALLGDFDCMLLQNLWGDKYEARVATLSPIVKGVLHYLQLNYHRNINREHIAEYLDINPEYLSRLFKQECDIQLIEYINHYKIDKSKEYMGKDSLYNIQKVASSVGFRDVNYYSRLFKKHTGMTPTEFRKKT